MPQTLPPIVQRFVMHFGEMGSRWGINRTVGQIYALLFVAEHPMHAEEIVEALGYSRSNVSTGLKELQAWNLVRLVHIQGDRRDHFRTPEDIWEIVRTLAEERKRREFDPTSTLLRELQLETPSDARDVHAQRRLAEMSELFDMLDDWYGDMRDVETERLIGLLKLGRTVQQAVKFVDKVTPLRRSRGGKPARSTTAVGSSDAPFRKEM